MKETIIATDMTIDNIIKQEIERYGNNADLNHIDVSKVTNMGTLFYESYFNGDISKWDVSNVTDMYCMFYKSDFNGDISKWDVSRVTDMRCMFQRSEFNGDISKWNVSKVTDMVDMFEHSNYTRDISKWGLYDIPPVGNEIIGWKKCKNDILVKLRIPAYARRSCASTNRTKKCRAETAIVLAIEDINGNPVYEAVSKYDRKFTYHAGDIKHIDNFDPCKWNECSFGIHFFENKEDAITYNQW